MSKTAITIEFDTDALDSYTDEFLATLWHLAQANPAPHADHQAGEVTERIGREIIRRWLREVRPELWHHQGRDYHWEWLTKLARYQPGDGQPGTPQWHDGLWVPRDPAESQDGAR
jgi:hypothetical protein